MYGAIFVILNPPPGIPANRDGVKLANRIEPCGKSEDICDNRKREHAA
jgi:hypothetical protein